MASLVVSFSLDGQSKRFIRIVNPELPLPIGYGPSTPGWIIPILRPRSRCGRYNPCICAMVWNSTSLCGRCGWRWLYGEWVFSKPQEEDYWSASANETYEAKATLLARIDSSQKEDDEAVNFICSILCGNSNRRRKRTCRLD